MRTILKKNTKSKILLVKTIEFDDKGVYILYHIELNGLVMKNSYTKSKKLAQVIFDKALQSKNIITLQELV